MSWNQGLPAFENWKAEHPRETAVINTYGVAKIVAGATHTCVMYISPNSTWAPRAMDVTSLSGKIACWVSTKLSLFVSSLISTLLGHWPECHGLSSRRSNECNCLGNLQQLQLCCDRGLSNHLLVSVNLFSVSCLLVQAFICVGAMDAIMGSQMILALCLLNGQEKSGFMRQLVWKSACCSNLISRSHL